MARPAKTDEEDVKVVARNRRAFHEYDILDRLECGIVLCGTEVKSLRDGHANLGATVDVRRQQHLSGW